MRVSNEDTGPMIGVGEGCLFLFLVHLSLLANSQPLLNMDRPFVLCMRKKKTSLASRSIELLQRKVIRS